MFHSQRRSLRCLVTQFTDKVVDVPVVAQRQISMVLTVQKSVEISQLQYCDEVIDVPVVLVVPVSTGRES